MPGHSLDRNSRMLAYSCSDFGFDIISSPVSSSIDNMDSIGTISDGVESRSTLM